MVIEGRLVGLPECAAKTVKRTMGHLPFDVYLGQTSRAECRRKKRHLDNTHIIIVYDTLFKVFIAWNASIRKALCAGENVVYDVSTKLLSRYVNEGFQNGSIVPVYIPRNGTNRKTNGYEKVLIIGTDALYDFCRHYDDYLYPSEDDSEYMQPSLFASPKHDVCLFEQVEFTSLIRIRSMFPRMEHRNTRVRKTTDSSEGKCAVCGLDEPHVLEAVPISQGRGDAAKSVYLCNNHRIMYECGLIDIDA